MSLAIYEHQTPVKLSQLLPVSILFVLTMIEWVSWTPATSFLRTVFSSLEVTASFWIAIGLLVISLIALACSATIRNLVSHSMYLMLADTAVVGWSPLRKTVVDLLPATFLSIVATILLFQAVPAAVRDISTVPHTVSLVYVLAIAVIFLLMAKVPRLVKVALDKRVRFIGRYECYCVLDASGLLAYVYDESSNRWNRRPEADLVVKGQQVALFDPTVQFTDHIKIASPTLEAGIDLTILATRDSFPGQITNEDITKIRHWVSAEASERKKLMEVAAGKLSSSFDKQTKAMFGISEQGQFIFDNVAKIIKGNTLKAWDMIAQIDCTAIARQLEHNFSAALFGRKAASLPIVYSVDVSVRSLDLKNNFKELNDSLLSINTNNSADGAKLRISLVEKLTELYTSYCTTSDPEQIRQVLEALLTDQPIRARQTDTTTSDRISVNRTGELLIPVVGDPAVYKAAEGLAELGSWLDNQPDLERKVADMTIWTPIYFELLKKKLIGPLPPGLRNGALATAIERSLHIDAAQIADPRSRLYEDYDFRMVIAGRIVNKN